MLRHARVVAEAATVAKEVDIWPCCAATAWARRPRATFARRGAQVDPVESEAIQSGLEECAAAVALVQRKVRPLPIRHAAALPSADALPVDLSD
eukprot:1378890-Prymnesium_polylepis.1